MRESSQEREYTHKKKFNDMKKKKSARYSGTWGRVQVILKEADATQPSFRETIKALFVGRKKFSLPSTLSQPVLEIKTMFKVPRK